MHDRVDAQLPDELADHRKTRVGMDEVHLLLRGDRIGDITAEELLHLRRQPARDL